VAITLRKLAIKDARALLGGFEKSKDRVVQWNAARTETLRGVP
jgi:hypothetical protein